ncbi:MAG: hypothetical protein ACKVHP_24990, partial [Verrucomicrobiales bacterium]
MKDAQIIFANPQWFFAFMLLVGVAILRYVSQARSTKLLDQMVASRLKTQLLGAHHPIRRE